MSDLISIYVFETTAYYSGWRAVVIDPDERIPILLNKARIASITEISAGEMDGKHSQVKIKLTKFKEYCEPASEFIKASQTMSFEEFAEKIDNAITWSGAEEE